MYAVCQLARLSSADRQLDKAKFVARSKFRGPFGPERHWIGTPARRSWLPPTDARMEIATATAVPMPPPRSPFRSLSPPPRESTQPPPIGNGRRFQPSRGRAAHDDAPLSPSSPRAPLYTTSPRLPRAAERPVVLYNPTHRLLPLSEDHLIAGGRQKETNLTSAAARSSVG